MDVRHDPEQYSQVKILGKGGYGVVNLFERRDGKEVIAIKHTNLNEERKFEARNEMLFTKNFQGTEFRPFFVQLVAQPWCERVGNTEHLHLPFEYCEGGDLFPYLGRVEEPRIKRIIFYVATGLRFMHLKQIAHRDIKAENILLTSKDIDKADFKICDLGVARVLSGGEEESITDLSHVEYEDEHPRMDSSAPEMSQRHYDCKVDVWSLGVLTKDLAFGRDAKASESKEEMEVTYAKNPMQYVMNAGCFSDDLIHFICATTSDVDHRPTIEQTLQLPFLASWRAQQVSALLTQNGLARLDRLIYKTKRNCVLAVSHQPSATEQIADTVAELEDCLKTFVVCAGPDLPPPQQYEDLLTVNRFLRTY